jgi:cell division protein FtsQ
LRSVAKTLLYFVLLCVSVGGSLWGLDRKGFFALEHIEIIVTQNTDQPRFMKPAITDLDEQMERLRGQSLWRIRLDNINQQVSSLPWISSLQVRRHWPDRLEVRIAPKLVKFLFVGKDGKLFPVLEDGTFLNPVAVENLPDVVLLRGDQFASDKQLLHRALATLSEIPDDGSFSKKTISEIRFDSKEGFWATMMKQGVRVKLGDDGVNLKADRISQVIDYLEANQLDARVIDANLTKKVLVRLRKGP